MQRFNKSSWNPQRKEMKQKNQNYSLKIERTTLT